MEIKFNLTEDQARKLDALLNYWADVVCDLDTDIDPTLPTTELCEVIVNQLESQIPIVLDNPEIVEEKECDCNDCRQCGCGGV